MREEFEDLMIEFDEYGFAPTITMPNAEEFAINYKKRLVQAINDLEEQLKNLDWYKMWHKKHKKEIEDLTAELETYRPTKLSGNGQCKCDKCGMVCWTDWFSRYKGQTLCDKCLKELLQNSK